MILAWIFPIHWSDNPSATNGLFSKQVNSFLSIFQTRANRRKSMISRSISVNFSLAKAQPDPDIHLLSLDHRQYFPLIKIISFLACPIWRYCSSSGSWSEILPSFLDQLFSLLKTFSIAIVIKTFSKRASIQDSLMAIRIALYLLVYQWYLQLLQQYREILLL